MSALLAYALLAGAEAEAEASAQRAGLWLGTVLFTLPAVWAGAKAWRAETASLRLASLACALGLLVFISPQLLFGLNPVDHRGAWMASAALKLLCGVGGMVCAALALVRRRQDSGTGPALPIVGGAFSGLHGLYGLSLMLMPMLVAPRGGEPWKCTLPDGKAVLVLPSRQWQAAPHAKGGVQFVNRLQRARGLAGARPADQAQYRQGVAALRENVAKDPTLKAKPEFEEGALPGGASYFFVMVVSSRLTGDGEVFAAVSEIWSQEQGTAVTVVYEGDLQALSETMKAAQLAGHKEAARKVCLGVEFP